MNTGMRRLCKIVQKGPACCTIAAQGESQNYRQQQHSNGVIPIEQFKAPSFFRQLLGVRPRTPAKHRDYTEHNGPRITLQNKHFRSLESLCRGLLVFQSLWLSTSTTPLGFELSALRERFLRAGARRRKSGVKICPQQRFPLRHAFRQKYGETPDKSIPSTGGVLCCHREGWDEFGKSFTHNQRATRAKCKNHFPETFR